jgi:hypothetical protein
VSTSKEPSADNFRFQALAKTVSTALQQRFGTKQYYTPDEVDAACNQCNVPVSSREYAVAMFVEPQQSQRFLQRLGSSKIAVELRKFLAQQIFFSGMRDVSYESATNDFHHAGDYQSYGQASLEAGSGYGGHDSGGHGGDGAGD